MCDITILVVLLPLLIELFSNSITIVAHQTWLKFESCLRPVGHAVRLSRPRQDLLSVNSIEIRFCQGFLLSDKTDNNAGYFLTSSDECAFRISDSLALIQPLICQESTFSTDSKLYCPHIRFSLITGSFCSCVHRSLQVEREIMIIN